MEMHAILAEFDLPYKFPRVVEKEALSISEKITDEKNTSEDWGMIMDFCDRVQATKDGPRDCLKSIIKRLNHQDPHVVIQAITVGSYTLLCFQ